MRRLLALAIVGCLAASACGAGRADAAVVNGQVITRDALNGELKDIAANKGFVTALEQLQGGPGVVQGTVPGTFAQSFVAYTLTRRIEYGLLHQELVRRHAVPNAAAVAAAKSETVQAYTIAVTANATATPLLAKFPAPYQTTLIERQADLDAVAKALTKTNVSDAAVRQYYDTHLSDFVTEVCVRHILVADQATATKIKAQLDAGGDFAALAKADSTDTASGATGGVLKGSAADGCLNNTDVSQLDPQFVSAILAQTVNQVGQPVQIQAGFDISEVTSRTVEPYDTQSQQAARQALEQPNQQDLSDLLTKLVQSATVKVDAAFGHFDKNGSSGPAVIPPSGPQVSTSGQLVTGSSTTTTATSAPSTSAG